MRPPDLPLSMPVAEACPTLTNMLVIIVGGIPIAMPTVLSVTLALGAATLAKEGAIVARMSAVEEMAGMDILCSDKTGETAFYQANIGQCNYNSRRHLMHTRSLESDSMKVIYAQVLTLLHPPRGFSLQEPSP